MTSPDSSAAPSQSRQPPGCLLIAGVICALLSLIAFGFAIRDLQMGTDSPNWPTVQGTVLRSELKSDNENYWAEITYEYLVDGAIYQGTNVRTLGFQVGTGLGDAQETISRYPVGASVLVHYDPASPRTAVLEPGSHGGGVVTALMAFILGFMAWASFRHWKARKAVQDAEVRDIIGR